MSNDSGPSKKLIIAGAIIFVVVIGVVLFLVLGSTGSPETEPEEQFAEFPIAPPNNVFTQPTVQVINDPEPVNVPSQQNMQDEIRTPIAPALGVELEKDQAELDALAFLNSQPRPNGITSVGQSDTAPAQEESERLTYEDIMAAIDENPGMLFADEITAEYFGDWRPPRTTAEAFAQFRDQSWDLEDRLSAETLAETAPSQQMTDISGVQIKSCGDIAYRPDTDTTEAELASAFSRDTSALCFGGEILDDCSSASVTNSGVTYLAGDFGNGCAVGTMAGSFANLCLIQPRLLSGTVSQDNRDTGKLLAELFVNPTLANCDLYRY